MVNLKFDNIKIKNVKTAITKQQQVLGLMWETEPYLLFFPYKQASIKKFWMKNTPSSLDIIFCKANTVIYIAKGEPYNENFVGPDQDVDFVLEAPFGFAEENNIKIGSKIKPTYSQFEILQILKT
jgi:uncharacterized protein